MEVQDATPPLSIEENTEAKHLEVTYSNSMQPLVELTVSGQKLRLVFDASSGNTIVFVKEKKACVPESLEECFSHEKAEEEGGLKVCIENNKKDINCETGPKSNYACDQFLASLASAESHPDALIIDGVEYDQKAVEGLAEMAVTVQGENSMTHTLPNVPVRLLVEAMTIPTSHKDIAIDLFQEAGGILGGSGRTLSCRNTTLWSQLLEREGVTRFALDLQPPPNATIRDQDKGRIVFNDLDPRYRDRLVWSQPKQTGDIIDDGMHEMLLYKMEVCGVDLLFNISSNWLTVIDTSGPCLMFPPFLFDRLMTRIPMDCPFGPGEKSLGRLCQPKRNGEQKLPSLSFAMEDARDPVPSRLNLPLERLVFRNASGHELLCVARDDTDTSEPTADMMYSHIAFGSMAVTAFYTVVDLLNHTVGFATKGNVETESSEASCIESVSCVGMQTYYPPLNLCEDPKCSDYIFMTMEDSTKTCKWSSVVPGAFGVLVVALAVLDLVGHRLYKQAVEKASEFSH